MVRARNTLLNTFVFYQGLAFLGSRAGEWMASLERGEGPARAFAELERHLATGAVSVLTARGWVEAGSFSEVGPIALDTRLAWPAAEGSPTPPCQARPWSSGDRALPPPPRPRSHDHEAKRLGRSGRVSGAESSSLRDLSGRRSHRNLVARIGDLPVA